MEHNLISSQNVDNSDKILQKLSGMRNDSGLSDLCLIVGGQVHLTHKLILSMSSEVFHTMLTSPQWPEAHAKEITLQEDPVCIVVFGTFLQYIYTGRIRLDHLNVLPVLMLADKYGLKDLSDVCIDYMSQHFVAPLNYCTVVSWYQYSLMCGNKFLQDSCEKFIIWNFQSVIESQDFTNMHLDNLCYFLRNSELVVQDEYFLFHCVNKWFKANLDIFRSSVLESKDENTKVVECFLSVMSGIRYPMMKLRQITLIIDDTDKEEFRQFYMEMLLRAVKYHTTPMNERSLLEYEVHYQPRNYTTDFWSTELSVDISTMDCGDIHGAFFSTPKSASDADENEVWDWHVDLYPKGVAFNPYIMIDPLQNYRVEGSHFKTVRLAVTSKSSDYRHVRMSVLSIGSQDGIQHVRNVVTKTCCFDRDNILHNMNDVVSYKLLNSSASPYCIGSDGNTFKIIIIIRPLPEMCY